MREIDQKLLNILDSRKNYTEKVMESLEAINAGATVNIQYGTKKNTTPLHLAAWLNNKVLVALLLEKYANKNLTTIHGFTAAQAAAADSRPEMAAFINNWTKGSTDVIGQIGAGESVLGIKKKLSNRIKNQIKIEEEEKLRQRLEALENKIKIETEKKFEDRLRSLEKMMNENTETQKEKLEKENENKKLKKKVEELENTVTLMQISLQEIINTKELKNTVNKTTETQTQKSPEEEKMKRRIEELENALTAAQTSLEEFTLREKQKANTSQEIKNDNEKNAYESFRKGKDEFESENYKDAFTFFRRAKHSCTEWIDGLVVGDNESDTATNLLKEITVKKKEAKDKINPRKNEAENNTSPSSFSQ